MAQGKRFREDILVCPETRRALSICSLNEAEKTLGGPLVPLRNDSPFGATQDVLLRNDHSLAFPIFNGIPILLAPEALGLASDRRSIDLGQPQYAEAYQEMAFYNGFAVAELGRIDLWYPMVDRVKRLSSDERQTFPEPRMAWLTNVYDCCAEWDCLNHIAPIENKRVLQLGGHGSTAVRLLVGGAREAWLVTPMIDEVRIAIQLAETFDVSDRLICVLGVAEELPFSDECFDVIWAAGCVHHMATDIAIPEIARVLRKGGKFAAVEPWHAPLYSIGTRVFGKREDNPFCRPLTRDRLAPLFNSFSTAETIQHGALTRYPLLALKKLRMRSSMSVSWNANKVDDAICALIPGLRSWGSVIACLGTK